MATVPAKHVSLTAMCHSAQVTKMGYITLDTQYINRYCKMATATLSIETVPPFRDVSGKQVSGHDAEGDAAAINKILVVFRLVAAAFLLFTTDGAKYQSNAILAHLDVPWLYCYCHRWSNVVHKAIGQTNEKLAGGGYYFGFVFCS